MQDHNDDTYLHLMTTTTTCDHNWNDFLFDFRSFNVSTIRYFQVKTETLLEDGRTVLSDNISDSSSDRDCKPSQQHQQQVDSFAALSREHLLHGNGLHHVREHEALQVSSFIHLIHFFILFYYPIEETYWNKNIFTASIRWHCIAQYN